jgi:hypothetical protein
MVMKTNGSTTTCPACADFRPQVTAPVRTSDAEAPAVVKPNIVYKKRKGRPICT